MGTMLISGRGAPCPAPAQCLEIDLSVEAEQARAQTRHMAWAQAEPLVQWAQFGSSYIMKLPFSEVFSQLS